MAEAYSFLAFFGTVSPREGWGKTKEAASIAVQKDERLPEGHGALALAKLHYDWDFAERSRNSSVRWSLTPATPMSATNMRTTHGHGPACESEAESKRAVELDPVGDGLNSCLCWHSFAARDYDEAVRLAAKFLKSEPDDPWERTILGWTYEQKLMPEQAVAEFKRAVEATNGDPFFLAPLGHAYALAGNRRKAEKILQTLNDRAKKSYVSSFDLALVYTALGERTRHLPCWIRPRLSTLHSSFTANGSHGLTRCAPILGFKTYLSASDWQISFSRAPYFCIVFPQIVLDPGPWYGV